VDFIQDVDLEADTARFLRAGRRIVEVPIGYRPSTRDRGEKISWPDGLQAIRTPIRCGFRD
jgi:hypothetical protein